MTPILVVVVGLAERAEDAIEENTRRWCGIVKEATNIIPMVFQRLLCLMRCCVGAAIEALLGKSLKRVDEIVEVMGCCRCDLL